MLSLIRLLLFAGAAVPAANSFATPAAAGPPAHPPTTTAIPEKAASPATAAAPYAARFIETRTIPGMKTPLVLHGTIRFTPGHHLLWAVEKPYTYRFEIAGKTITEVLPDGSRRTSPLAKTPWAQALFKLFSSILGGNPHALARYFDLKPTAEGMILTPRSKVLAKWVTRIVAVGKPLPRKVTIVGSDGGETRLEFTPLKPLPVPAPATAGQ